MQLIFFPVAIEMAGTYNNLAIELIQEIGKRTSTITEELLETIALLLTYLDGHPMVKYSFFQEHFLNQRRLRAHFSH